MKKLLPLVSITILCAIFLNVARAAAADEPKAIEAQGIIKEKLDKPDRIILTIPGAALHGVVLYGAILHGAGPSEKEFIYKHDNKKECLSFDELKTGDNVVVTYKQKEIKLEATCIKRVTP